MKNRAKCKLCKSIIESMHPTDHVTCKCGEISVDACDAMVCFAKDWSNFLRVDDLGNEIIVTVKQDKTASDAGLIDDISTKPDKEELLRMLDEMIKNIENLPQHAMITPVNHYDFASALILLSSLFRS